jgi:hypothetical protein
MEETVKYNDGTEVTVEIYSLGFRKATQIGRKHLPINDLTFGKDDTMNIKGDIDLFGMALSCLETVIGIDLDKITAEEGNRIYKKYFEKDVLMTLGKGGNPN